MKYKVGDKVKIHGVADHRKRYNGKVVTIKSINPNSNLNFKLAPHYGVGECYIFYENELAPVNSQKIVITTDGTETLARLYDGKTVIKTATAKCSSDDTFDFDTGAKIAFDRLNERTLTKSLRKLSEALQNIKVPKIDFNVKKKPLKIEVGKKYVLKPFDEVNSLGISRYIWKDISSQYVEVLKIDGGNVLAKSYNGLKWWFCNKSFEKEYVEEKPFKFEVGKQYKYDDCVIEITDARRNDPYSPVYKYKDVKGDTLGMKHFAENSFFANKLTHYEPPKYYNGKVVCVEKSADYMAYTIGKVYEFKDGRVKIDNGNIIPAAGQKPVSSVDEWNNDPDTYAKFIPFVE